MNIDRWRLAFVILAMATVVIGLLLDVAVQPSIVPIWEAALIVATAVAAGVSTSISDSLLRTTSHSPSGDETMGTRRVILTVLLVLYLAGVGVWGTFLTGSGHVTDEEGPFGRLWWYWLAAGSAGTLIYTAAFPLRQGEHHSTRILYRIIFISRMALLIEVLHVATVMGFPGRNYSIWVPTVAVVFLGGVVIGSGALLPRSFPALTTVRPQARASGAGS